MFTENPRCAICESSSHLFACSRCKVIWYCSRSHQASDVTSHEFACVAIKKATARLKRKERELRNKPGDVFFAANPFDNSVGHFWGITETRDYMRARMAVVESLLKVKTRGAVQAALDHAEDILRLNRSDNLGVRDYMPAMYLRLGRDQDCYDFVMWFETTGSRGYDWGNMELPFLDIQDADVFEPFHNLLRHADLSHSVALTLLKVKLFLDLRSLKTFLEIENGKDRLPQEIMYYIASQLMSQVFNSYPARLRTLMDEGELDDTIIVLDLQIRETYRVVEKANKYFWRALLKPGRHLAAEPEYYTRGSVEGMQVALQQSYDAWAETPGAIDVIRLIREGQQ